MDLSAHGGHCCGRRHIYHMDGATTESIRDYMQRSGLLTGGVNKMTEIVVSEENDDLEELRTEIVGAGFVLVGEWDNDSGSRCYMYMHVNDGVFFPNGAAVNVRQPAPPPPAPAREAPRIVSSTFHNVYARSGRSAAGWPSREEAAAAAPRAVSIDRRDVYASGAVRWAEGV